MFDKAIQKAVSFVSPGRDTGITNTTKRHADKETMDHLIKLQTKARIYEEALLKIYWETEDVFTHNVVAVSLKKAEDL